MSNDFVKFNLEADSMPLSNSYPSTDIQYIYIDDNDNSAKYSGQFIKWTNANISGNTAEKMFDWSHAYTAIPIESKLTATGCKFGINSGAGLSSTDENNCALAPKPFHHFIDLYQGKYNNTNINRSSNYQNFILNEKYKTMDEDEYRLYGDILNNFLDSTESYEYDDNLGEMNNNLKAVDITSGHLAGVNQGHLARIKKNNMDLRTNKLYEKILGKSNLELAQQNGLYSSSDTELVFRFILIIPLAKLHDFYDKISTCASANGFELILQLNAGSSNSWRVTYEKETTAITSPNTKKTYTVKNISVNQVVGRCCPFLLSKAGHNNGTGLSLVPNNTTDDFSVNITSTIGWSGSLPCRIYVPTVVLNPEISISSKPFRILYNDFYVDEILGVQGSKQKTRQFPMTVSRPRTLYIIPFLSKTGVTLPYQSPLSSAPTTCSPCRLTNFNFQIGGSPVFAQALQYNYSYYNENVLSLISRTHGNSIKSAHYSGLITSSMWEKNYGVYVFNLEKVTNETADNIPKSFNFSFTVNANPNYTYDFLVFVEYQNELYLDRISGMITTADQQQ